MLGQTYAFMILYGQKSYPYNNTEGAGPLKMATNGWANWRKVDGCNLPNYWFSRMCIQLVAARSPPAYIKSWWGTAVAPLRRYPKTALIEGTPLRDWGLGKSFLKFGGG